MVQWVHYKKGNRTKRRLHWSEGTKRKAMFKHGRKGYSMTMKKKWGR